jgi:hypothetical protein
MCADDSRASMVCEKRPPVGEYSRLQEFVNNLPYAMMIVLGTVVVFIALERPAWRWMAAGAYVLYGIAGAFWIILFLCPHCGYYGTRSCPCGYGRVAAKLREKQDGTLFGAKFKKHIPVIVPLWVIPVLAGGISLVLAFSWLMLVLVIIFAFVSYVILPLVSRTHSCAHCPQKDQCPWMGGKGSKSGP